MTRHRPYLPLAGFLVAGLALTAADPPSKPSVDKPAVGKGEKKEKVKLPTTKEEFKALADTSPFPPWIQGENGRQEVAERRVDGLVVKVTDDSIAIRLKGEDKEMMYPAHLLLVTGATCHWEDDSNCYLLPDVQKGDEVMLTVGAVDKESGDECFAICIRKRPGGKVPPSRKPTKVEPWHERRNLKNGYEERGELSPDELKSYEEKKKFHAERGLPPPPPPKPPTPPGKTADEPKKDDPPKKDDKK